MSITSDVDIFGRSNFAIAVIIMNTWIKKKSFLSWVNPVTGAKSSTKF